MSKESRKEIVRIIKEQFIAPILYKKGINKITKKNIKIGEKEIQIIKEAILDKLPKGSYIRLLFTCSENDDYTKEIKKIVKYLPKGKEPDKEITSEWFPSTYLDTIKIYYLVDSIIINSIDPWSIESWFYIGKA